MLLNIRFSSVRLLLSSTRKMFDFIPVAGVNVTLLSDLIVIFCLLVLVLLGRV